MLNGWVSSATNMGSRGYQEDRIVIFQISIESEKGWLLAVMDGHSGHMAAEFCAKNLPEYFLKTSAFFLNELIRILYNETKNMSAGCTISLVYISETKRKAFVAVLGDSPIIIKNKEQVWLSPEHNIRTNENDREKVVLKGAAYFNGYMCNPRTGRGLQLTRSLGDSEFDQFLIREPEIFNFDLDESSIVLVASDGLIDPKHGDRDITKFLKMAEEGKTASDLVKDALYRQTEDNVTAIIWRPKIE